MIKTIKPPPNFTKNGEIYVPKHHSVTDWDFQHDALYRSLSPAAYVSFPTSLKFTGPDGNLRSDTILCRIAETQCLAQGEVRTWVRWKTYGQYPAIFRNQHALGGANLDDCYALTVFTTSWKLYRVIDGGFVLIGETAASSSVETWEHWRTVYWNGLTPDLEEALCVELYKEVDSSWVKQGDTLYDTQNQFKDSEINRSGFDGRFDDTWTPYFDDTEIWGPSE
jgi:hypothetical protein